MCYSRGVERIGIRELRNYASRVVRRAQAGERVVITVDGVPAAQIVPLTEMAHERTLDDLIRAGLRWPPRPAHPGRPAPPAPYPSQGAGRQRRSCAGTATADALSRPLGTPQTICRGR